MSKICYIAGFGRKSNIDEIDIYFLKTTIVDASAHTNFIEFGPKVAEL